MFHDALRPDGVLFLGEAQGLSRHAELSNPLDSRNRIFQRRDRVSTPMRLRVPGQRQMTTTTDLGGDIRHTVESRVLERFAPAHVVVNADGDIVHASRRTGDYLEPPADQPGRQLLLLARQELRLDLGAALQQATETGRPASRNGIAVPVGRDTQLLDIIVEPLSEPSTEPLFLVVFDDAGPLLGPDGGTAPASDGDSTPERLDRTQNDLRNVVDSTQIALVFLDEQLRIRSFTAAAAGLFDLRPSDRGRPLGDIPDRLGDSDLDRDIRAALTRDATMDRRVSSRDGKNTYLLRILPYHGTLGTTIGVTVTLFGIDTVVDAEEKLQTSVAELQTRIRQQGAVAEFGAKALRANDLDALLHEASVVIANCLGIQRAKVLQLLPDRDRLLIRAGVGWDPDVVGKVTIGADDQSPAGVALKTGEPVVSEDLERDTRFEVPQVLRDHGIRSAVNVLIRGETEPFGVLEADSQDIHRFSADDVGFLQSCAHLVAAALDRLRNEGALKRTVEEKQVLLYELQHRVKNSLQEMSALVNIERRKVREPSMRRALEVLGARLEALRVIYRRLYLVDHHTEIDLGDYLGELSGDLFLFHGIDAQDISRDLRLEPVRVNLDQALPVGLIACEFIVNSLKHAFPEGKGRITLALEQADENHVKITLGDNGIGLQEKGNPESGSGLQLIRRLIAQIGGTIDLSGTAGVTMTILFPLQRHTH